MSTAEYDGEGMAVIYGGLLKDETMSATACLVYAAISYAKPGELDWGVIMRQARARSMTEVNAAVNELRLAGYEPPRTPLT